MCKETKNCFIAFTISRIQCSCDINVNYHQRSAILKQRLHVVRSPTHTYPAYVQRIIDKTLWRAPQMRVKESGDGWSSVLVEISNREVTGGERRHSMLDSGQCGGSPEKFHCLRSCTMTWTTQHVHRMAEPELFFRWHYIMTPLIYRRLQHMLLEMNLHENCVNVRQIWVYNVRNDGLLEIFRDLKLLTFFQFWKWNEIFKWLFLGDRMGDHYV